MRILCRAILVLGVLLGGSAAARAGLYNSLELKRPITLNYQDINFNLADFRSVRVLAQQFTGNPPPHSYWAQVVRQMADLEPRLALRAVSVVERADLGAIYIRLGRPERAIAVLEAGLKQTATDEPARFLLLANLAVAYQDINVLERAVEFQRQALAAWPERLPGWSKAELVWYRRVDRFYLTLLTERLRESRQNDGRFVWTAPDNLFPGVSFVGQGDKYRAGHMDPDQYDRLPPDAPHIVLILLLWQPFDERLLWLFAELLNSRGEVDNAYDIMDKLVRVNTLTNIIELRKHRLVLSEGERELKAYRENLSSLQSLLGTLASTENPWPALAVQEYLRRSPTEPKFNGSIAPPPDSKGALPDWRVVVVSFISGWLVAILVGLQWRELRRRHQGLARPPTA